MAGRALSALAMSALFAETARGYWLEVFPQVGREVASWRIAAAAIPDPTLRRLALATQVRERGNLDGAAAFAVLAPRAQRARLVRATVAFQAAYDYLDTLAEQSCEDPRGTGRELHLALLRALDPGAGHGERLALSGDGGYTGLLVDACRDALQGLPSWSAALAPARLAAERMVAYQSLNHGAPDTQRCALASWASALTPAGSGLRWWETAAAAASSLGVFALMSAAAAPALRDNDAESIARAYFPWVGALHVLLDSLIDARNDARAGDHSLVAHYSSADETAARLRVIARRALSATQSLPDAGRHALVLCAMASFYLSSPAAGAPEVASARRQVLCAMGGAVAPAMAVLCARRAVAAMIGRASARREPLSAKSREPLPAPRLAAAGVPPGCAATPAPADARR